MINYKTFFYKDDVIEWQQEFYEQYKYMPKIIAINFVTGNHVTPNEWVVWYQL